MTNIWHNGAIRPAGPVFSPQDRIRFGDGVFDTMLAVNGKPVFAEDHAARLLRHAATLGITITYTSDKLIAAAKTLLTGTQEPAIIRTLITRGATDTGLAPDSNATANVTLYIEAAPAAPAPLRAVIARLTRRNDLSPLSRIKSLNYADSILALAEAKSRGANEAILLNTRGHAVCTGAGNIFVLRGGQWFTPPLADGAVDGIIRAKFLARTGAAERSLTEDDLQAAESLYITSSVRGAVPVVTFEGRDLPAPPPGIPAGLHLE